MPHAHLRSDISPPDQNQSLPSPQTPNTCPLDYPQFTINRSRISKPFRVDIKLLPARARADNQAKGDSGWGW
eukprot:731612-Amorphochlora_amoeboformis.AAC.1